MDINQNNEIVKINSEKKNNNKKIIIITSISVLFLVIGIIVLAITGIFKSKGEKFVELLTKDQHILEIIENKKDEYFSDGETNLNLTLKNKFLTTIDKTFSLLGTDIILNTNTIKQGENIDAKASLKLETFELQSLELVKENEIIALSVPNLFENFIAINNANTSKLAEKLGFITESENEKIQEEALEIMTKYAKVLVKSINDYIDINNSQIELNNSLIKTKEYKLSFNEKNINEIALNILEKLKDDDKTINFIVKYVGEEYQGLTNETLKEEIVNMYNQLLEKSSLELSTETIAEIKLNVLDDKTMQTTININGTTEIIIASNVINGKDYILVSIKINETKLNFEFNGEKLEKIYRGILEIKAEDASLPVAELDIEKLENGTNKVRKISELNVLLLNEATDEEIDNLRKEIEKNLGISENEAIEATIYEEGEFRLDNPDSVIKILDPSVKAYNELTIGMSKEDAIKLMGEPSASFEVNERENMGWYYDETNSIYYISLELTEGKISKVYNDIVSDMEDNVQISTELGTEIEDLTKLVSDLKYGITKNEVINILGDKYLEISKDEEGYKTYKWYDKRENIIVIEFDSEEKVSYVDTVTMDI